MTKKINRWYERKYRRQMRYAKKAKLHRVPTCSLVEELTKREGVSAVEIDPYAEQMVHVTGPAVLLTVID